MILSVSRRTDIPNYYSEWFLNRIKEGFLYVRNPMNPKQISRIDLSPQVVDCIVFWTKNPEPMMNRLEELKEYSYYFQFTLTGYGQDIERNLPHKKDKLIPMFQKLSDKIGSRKIIWRYDPIIFTEKYTPEYHKSAFTQIATECKGYTSRCVISFVDLYAKNKKSMLELGAYELGERELRNFAKELADIAHKNQMTIGTCAEKADLSEYGIGHSCCIDKEHLETILGCKINGVKDRNQRIECGCMESIDVGTYDTCKTGCKYCYATESGRSVMVKNVYDPDSPLLCGIVREEDKIRDRKVRSLKDGQLSISKINAKAEIGESVCEQIF